MTPDQQVVIVAAVVAGVLSVIAGIVGGRVGGKLAIRASKESAQEAARLTRKLDQYRQLEQLRGVLLGIREEVELLWERFSNEYGDHLESLGSEEYFEDPYPLYEEYLTVYKANASLLGQIPSDEMRKVIIKTYLNAQGLIDCLKLNNELLERLREALLAGGPVWVAARVTNDLRRWAPTIQTLYRQTKVCVTELRSLMDASPLLRDHQKGWKNDRV